MENTRIAYLYQCYITQNLSDNEWKEFKQLLSSGKTDQTLMELIDSEWAALKDEQLLDIPSDQMKAVFDHVVSHPQKSEKSAKMWPRMMAAAAIIVALCAGAYQYFNSSLSSSVSHIAKTDIAPGKIRATLTLGNGQKILLSNVASGQIARQGGVIIKKAANGEVVYVIADESTAERDQLNTLSTANGETYQVNLPDGTHVWLNASSSLTYPARFAGAERKVSLKGEGYFEVAKDKAHPFKVSTAFQEVAVLGTHFNINAYENEEFTKTTLLEGSVKVSTDHSNKMIVPGQQTVMRSGELTVKEIDTELATAWKNNKFIFDGEDIPYIMRMVERWYNVKVYYDGEVPSEKFYGAVSRYENISEVLKALDYDGKVHFKVDDRKITVSK